MRPQIGKLQPGAPICGSDYETFYPNFHCGPAILSICCNILDYVARPSPQHRRHLSFPLSMMLFLPVGTCFNKNLWRRLSELPSFSRHKKEYKVNPLLRQNPILHRYDICSLLNYFCSRKVEKVYFLILKLSMLGSCV